MTWGTPTSLLFLTPTRTISVPSPKEDALNSSPTPTKMEPNDTTGSFDGKPATAMTAATDPPNTLGNPSRTDGQASDDGQRTEFVPPAPSTMRTPIASGATGKRLTSLSGLLKADNVGGVLYLGDYATVEIKVTFQNGAKDSKTIAAGETRNMALALVLIEDNPLDAHGKFFEVSPKL